MQVCVDLGYVALSILASAFCPVNSVVPKKLWATYQTAASKRWIGMPIKDVWPLMTERQQQDLIAMMVGSPKVLRDILTGQPIKQSFTDELRHQQHTTRALLQNNPKTDLDGITLRKILECTKIKHPHYWDVQSRRHAQKHPEAFLQQYGHLPLFSTGTAYNKMLAFIKELIGCAEAGCPTIYKGTAGNRTEQIYRSSDRFFYVREAYLTSHVMVDEGLLRQTKSIEQRLLYFYTAYSFFCPTHLHLSISSWAAMFGLQGSDTCTWASRKLHKLVNYGKELKAHRILPDYHITNDLKEKRGYFMVHIDDEELNDRLKIVFPTPTNPHVDEKRPTPGIGMFIPLRPDFFPQMLEVSQVYYGMSHVKNTYKKTKPNKLTKGIKVKIARKCDCFATHSPHQPGTSSYNAACPTGTNKQATEDQTSGVLIPAAPRDRMFTAEGRNPTPHQQCAEMAASMNPEGSLSIEEAPSGCSDRVTSEQGLLQQASACANCSECGQRQYEVMEQQCRKGQYRSKGVFLTKKTTPQAEEDCPQILKPTDARFSKAALLTRWEACSASVGRQSMPEFLTAVRFTAEEKVNIQFYADRYFASLMGEGRETQSVLQEWTHFLWQTGILNRLQHPNEQNQWTWRQAKHLQSVCRSAFRLGEVEELTLIANYVLGELPRWFVNPKARSYLLQDNLKDCWLRGNQDRLVRQDVEDCSIRVPINVIGPNYIEARDYPKGAGDFSRCSTAHSMSRTISAISDPTSLFDQLQQTLECERKYRTGLRTAKTDQAFIWYDVRVKKYESMAHQQMRQWASIPLVLLLLLSKRFTKTAFMKVFSVKGKTATLSPDKLLTPQLKLSSFGWSAQAVTTASIDDDNPTFYQPQLPADGISSNAALKVGLVGTYHRVRDDKLLHDFVLGLGKNPALQEDLFLWSRTNIEKRFSETTGQSIDATYGKFLHVRKHELGVPKPAKPVRDPEALVSTSTVLMQNSKGSLVMMVRQTI